MAIDCTVVKKKVKVLTVKNVVVTEERSWTYPMLLISVFVLFFCCVICCCTENLFKLKVFRCMKHQGKGNAYVPDPDEEIAHITPY